MRIRSIFQAAASLALVLLVATSAVGQTRSEVRKAIEASLLVTGDITISATGKVGEFKLDAPEKLPKEVLALIDSALPAWEFEPVIRNGAAISARSRMSLRLVANKRDDGDYLLAIRSAAFTGDSDDEVDKTWLAKQRMDPPTYPTKAARAGVSGTVYLIVKVGRDGRVEDAFAEQTNLRYVDNEKQMARWRTVLEQSALVAARSWQFTADPHAESEADGSRTVRVPVDYSFGKTTLAYGTWSPYIPGPRALAPWVKPEFARAQDIDAGQDGTLAPVGAGVRLKTDLSQG
jgi:outer membrane biosynthesis protein TonB